MNTTLHDLIKTLESYFSAVQGGDAGELRPLIDKLDHLGKNPDPAWHPQLKHYLESKSYRKAQAFLCGDSTAIPRGNCGRTTDAR